ncbi:MAG: hypothetical protein L0H83_04085, partial [Salinisphaera sp.]|nr:hypothetical protein [Salinisphaera sp.]
MTAERDLVLHGIAIKKHGTPEEIAGITGVALDTVREVIAAAVETGRALQAKGKVMLTPAAQMALNGGYANTYAPQRGDQTFLAAYHDFETINLDL